MHACADTGGLQQVSPEGMSTMNINGPRDCKVQPTVIPDRRVALILPGAGGFPPAHAANPEGRRGAAGRLGGLWEGRFHKGASSWPGCKGESRQSHSRDAMKDN